MSKRRILVVDDEEGMLEVCFDTLSSLSDTTIVLEKESEQAVKRLESEHFDLLIADIRMPGVDGVGLLRIAREQDPTLAVLMLTAFPTVESAVESMKLGAADYVTKPFLPDDLVTAVSRLLESKRLREENRLLRRQVERAYYFDEIVGKSATMSAVFELMQRLSATDVDILITGETGTGKELIARSIHKRSKRKHGRFVPVDCGAIPENLLESEFFGYERGAFTGAHKQNLGLLEFAEGGTFFLDEVAELPLQLQVKLLRALQERKFRRVGGKEEISVDVRIMAATNHDLRAMMREGRFRQDLYYRINVACIEIPPLRERHEDIHLLVEHFVERYGREMARDAISVEPEAMEILNRYPWPGNVRELQNVLKRTLAVTTRDALLPDDLPDEVVIRAGDRPVADRGGFFNLRAQRIATFEKEYLANLLQTCSGDVSRAARDAQLPRGTLYRLLKKHGLNAESFRA